VVQYSEPEELKALRCYVIVGTEVRNVVCIEEVVEELLSCERCECVEDVAKDLLESEGIEVQSCVDVAEIKGGKTALIRSSRGIAALVVVRSDIDAETVLKNIQQYLQLRGLT